ncbi:MAG: YggT family protein [Gemmatimonadales bacterium]
MFDVIAINLVRGVRVLVAAAFVLSVIAALTHWAVRRGQLNAFGAWARLVRRWSDPVMRPIERRLVRVGANPQDAPLWLVGIAVVGGLLVIASVDWLVSFVFEAYNTARGGYLVFFVLRSVFELLKLALIVRVIASWLSVSPYHRFMRLINGLTDWLVEPIRRVLPPLGMLDFSPLVAYLVLYLAENLVLRMAMP